MSFKNPFRKLFQYKPDWEMIQYEQEVESSHGLPERLVEFKNESDRLDKEYTKLSKKNEDLFNIIEDLNDFAVLNFDKTLLITMIYRTEKEQDYLYRNSAKYARRKFKSPHQFWHGVDLRSRTFSDEQIARMVDYINDKYNKINYYRFTADYHQVGNNGFHFHIQFSRKRLIGGIKA